MAKAPTKTEEETSTLPAVSTGTGVAQWADRLAAKAGEGLEDVRTQDMALPMFKLLQSLSPETKRAEAAYIEGAEEGVWCDVIGRGIYDSIVFVPARYVTHYLEWRTRKDGGGLVANHGTDDSLMAKCMRDEETGRNITPNGTELVRTPTWFGIVVSGEQNGVTVPLNKRAVITLSGTQQKASRRWVSDIMSIRLTNSQGKPFIPPCYAMGYRLGSSPTKNDRGSWYLATIDRAGWTLDFENGEVIFEEASAFADIAKDLKPVNTDNDENVAAPARSGPREEAPPLDDNIPF